MDNTQTTTVENALNILKQAMIDDDPSEPGSYAHSWHCNIACMCHDAIYKVGIKKQLNHTDVYKIGNDAASRFMKLCFGVETKA